jgi:hypothetical protein
MSCNTVNLNSKKHATLIIGYNTKSISLLFIYITNKNVLKDDNQAHF